MFEIEAAWFAENGRTDDICEISAEFATMLDPPPADVEPSMRAMVRTSGRSS